MNRRALVRRPSPRLAEGLITHIARTPVDPELAQQQWEGYVAALRAEGWEHRRGPAGRRLPRRGLRRGHRRGLRRPRRHRPARAPTSAGRRPPAPRRRSPASATGSRGSRSPARWTAATSSSTAARCGWASAAARTSPGWSSSVRCSRRSAPRVVGVPVSRVLHLKSAVTALPDGTVVGFEPLVDDPRPGTAFLPVPEEAGSHVVLLDGGHRADVDQRPADAGAVRGARAARRGRRHQRVREARGLRHLPVGAPARLTRAAPRPARPSSEPVLGGRAPAWLRSCSQAWKKPSRSWPLTSLRQRVELRGRAVAVAVLADPACAAAARRRRRRSAGAAPGGPSRRGRRPRSRRGAAGPGSAISRFQRSSSGAERVVPRR